MQQLQVRVLGRIIIPSNFLTGLGDVAASSCTCSGSSISSRVLCASGHVATKAVPVNAMLDFLMCGIVWSKRRLITSMILSIWTSGLVVHGGAIHLVRWQKGGCIVKANMSELNQEAAASCISSVPEDDLLNMLKHVRHLRLHTPSYAKKTALARGGFAPGSTSTGCDRYGHQNEHSGMLYRHLQQR